MFLVGRVVNEKSWSVSYVAIVTNIGVLAQLVEQRTLNPFVASSILARPTN